MMEGANIDADKIEAGTKAAFKSMKEQVRRLLKDYTRCRNDDAFLIVKVLEQRGALLFDKSPDGDEIVILPLANLEMVGSFETIRRVRAEIQNVDGQYLPTDPAVLVKRRIREDAIREYYADKPEKIREYQERAYGVQ